MSPIAFIQAFAKPLAVESEDPNEDVADQTLNRGAATYVLDVGLILACFFQDGERASTKAPL